MFNNAKETVFNLFNTLPLFGLYESIAQVRRRRTLVRPRPLDPDSPFVPERRQRRRPSRRPGTLRDYGLLRSHGVRDQQHLQRAEGGRHQLHHHALPSQRSRARRHTREQAARVAGDRHRGRYVPARPQADLRLALPHPAVHQETHASSSPSGPTLPGQRQSYHRTRVSTTQFIIY
jgi:hypothetical protein